jgi:hypothetical protein
MYRSSLMTPGQDRWSFYRQLLLSINKTAIPTLTTANTLCYIAEDFQDFLQAFSMHVMHIYIHLSLQAQCFEKLCADF